MSNSNKSSSFIETGLSKIDESIVTFNLGFNISTKLIIAKFFALYLLKVFASTVNL
jgi:hypothetical protein